MKTLSVYDVRAQLGDTGFLLDDGQTAVLCDTGFSFTAEAMANRIEKQLGGRKLDYILLTHSHYDHVLGVPHILRKYPDAKVVAAGYAAKIFQKPTARALMHRLDCRAAAAQGLADIEDLTHLLKVDVEVEDGQLLCCGAMAFQVLALPGHTRCCTGFYLADRQLLVSTETLGVYGGGERYMPCFLMGYQMALDSFEKVRHLPIRQMIVPHWGVLEGQEARKCLTRCEEKTVEAASTIACLLREGKTAEQVLEYFRQRDYRPELRTAYPIEAFTINTLAMIEQTKKELLPEL